MAEEDLSLDELSDRSGVPARLIRSYIEQGLLRGPATRGRYARYSLYHRDRLLAIRVLREEGFSLAETRARLLSMSDEQVARMGATAGAATPTSALEYLQRVTTQAQATPPSAMAARGGAAAGPAAPAGLLGKRPEEATSFERLLFALQTMLASKRVDRRARAEPVYRIEITPEIEFHVRGAVTPEALGTLERLADYLREIALGGAGPSAPT